jgi:hypothetical protein
MRKNGVWIQVFSGGRGNKGSCFKKFILKILQQKFGSIKKINSSLHQQNKNMQQILSHIETANRFSPKGDYAMAGQVLLHE